MAFATIVGTSIEWYDYFLFAAASGLIFNQLFFGPLGSTLSTMVAFATIGISFLFRPSGAFLAGHFGDKLGRRVVLIITLIAMGAATALIGFLPTYESAGILAPILLIALRIVQGISAGGEWGGAVLLAVEHADKRSRGLHGSFPQIGVRFSGVSVSYAIGSILGGAFAPTIAKALVSSTGTTTSVAVYLGIVAVLSLTATLLLRDRTGIPLGPDHEDEQSVSPIIGVGSPQVISDDVMAATPITSDRI